jgi:hypothetical protein
MAKRSLDLFRLVLIEAAEVERHVNVEQNVKSGGKFKRRMRRRNLLKAEISRGVREGSQLHICAAALAHLRHKDVRPLHLAFVRNARRAIGRASR